MSLVRLFTDFEGRIGLRQFWLGSALIALTLLGVQKFAPSLFFFHAEKIVAFANAFALFPWAALAAKRASDRGSAPLYGILLICTIVLPGQLQPWLPYLWAPSLDTVSLIAWLFALVDLGLMPSARGDARLAVADGDAKAARWTRQHAPHSTSIPSTPSR